MLISGDGLITRVEAGTGVGAHGGRGGKDMGGMRRGRRREGIPAAWWRGKDHGYGEATEMGGGEHSDHRLG